MFTEKDLQQIKDKGLTSEQIELQIENFKKGFPFIVLSAPATLGNGLNSYSEQEAISLSKYFDDNYKDYEILKFVPASGAASRMFKHLFEFRQTYNKTPEDIEKYKSDKGFNSVFNFFENINKFAFYHQLKKVMAADGHELDKLISDYDFKSVLDYFLTGLSMDYASLPKGLLLFHDYPDEPRLSVEEHLVEGAHYSTDKTGVSRVHLTVSPEHQSKFESAVNNKKGKFENKFDVKFNIKFSQQKPTTDIIAVTPENEPFRNGNGSLLFRPGGHGALIENLNDLKGEIVFIKNIDNIVPDRLRDTTYLYKKVIGGLLFKLQSKTFEYLDLLDAGNIETDELNGIRDFARDELNIFIPDAYMGYDHMDKVDFLYNKLNRPIRVCGMVKNEGEPGGGPFWIIDRDDNLSLQIVESSQMELNNESQKEIIAKATHFNPVDLVCGIKDYNGNNFDLKEFVDPETGFISLKSQGGKSLKAQELPGLWNGAMADWITVFVETPIITFNPVKTINDLLRPQHQPEL
ncbi:MAG: DUF4301 family protein [Bacteroidetes bacterium]|nr:DUF4301 family protein [Bacteroidota bacterium]